MSYTSYRDMRLTMAHISPDYPNQPKKRVLMRWYTIGGGFRKPGTVDNTAVLRKYFRERHMELDRRIEAQIEHMDQQLGDDNG
jgi:hypothetical protein